MKHKTKQNKKPRCISYVRTALNKLAQNMKSQDFTCLNKNVILRFTCNTPTPKVTIYKCVGIFHFNLIMRKTAANTVL